MHIFQTSSPVEIAAVERALKPLRQFSRQAFAEPLQFGGSKWLPACKHCTAYPAYTANAALAARSAREEGSAASTEASKAHGCSHVWIQAVFVLIIVLGFSLHAEDNYICWVQSQPNLLTVSRAASAEKSVTATEGFNVPGAKHGLCMSPSSHPVAWLCPKPAELSSSTTLILAAVTAWTSPGNTMFAWVTLHRLMDHPCCSSL